MRFLTERRFEGAPVASVLGVDATVADRCARRALGLMLLPREHAPAALLVPRCSSVHTFGMRFPIDVVFLDREGREIARRRRVPPRRLVARRGAHSVLELPAD